MMQNAADKLDKNVTEETVKVSFEMLDVFVVFLEQEAVFCLLQMTLLGKT